jgi:hypothetical protein
MQQRQPRLGDILDDYCPRERRLTNHVVVAMVGDDIKQTRCTTCDADHVYKQAKIPKQRTKAEAAALSAIVASAPKRVVHESMSARDGQAPTPLEPVPVPEVEEDGATEQAAGASLEDPQGVDPQPSEEGPVHRTLIRAQLPRTEGQPPPSRPGPDFTIRQPAGRQNRFGARHQRGGTTFQGQGNRQHGSGQGNAAGGAARQPGGRPPLASRLGRRQGPGGKHSK